MFILVENFDFMKISILVTNLDFIHCFGNPGTSQNFRKIGIFVLFV